MEVAKDTFQTGYTVQYGSIVFGYAGANATYRMMPPEIDVVDTQAEYDESGRAVVAWIYTVNVRTVIYSATGLLQDTQAALLRTALLTPGQNLTIPGLGFGINGTVIDSDWGPKPIKFSLRALGGGLANRLEWSVQFRVNRCSTTELFIESLAYQSQWSYDEAGFATRTISGKVTMPASADTTSNLAEAARSALSIATPENFKRIANQWQLQSDNRSVMFSVTDTELVGDAPPPGCVDYDGRLSIDSEGPAFAKAMGSLSMEIELQKGAGPDQAIAVFMPKFLGAQAALRNSINLGAEKATLYPTRIAMQRGLGRSARQYNFAVQWYMAGCISNVFINKDAWEAVPTDTYDEWIASIPAGAWGSRGTGGYEDSYEAVLSTCSYASTKTIGNVTTNNAQSTYTPTAYELACPDVSENASWLYYDARVQVVQKQQTSLATLALNYVDSLVRPADADASSGPAVIPVGNIVSQSDSDEHVLEYQGYPVTMVLLQFQGIRIKHSPTIPIIKTINGKSAFPVRQKTDGPKTIGSLAGCSVRSVNAAVLYCVVGAVNSIKEHGQATVCGNLGVFENL